MSILSFSFASILVIYVISVDDVTQSDWRVRFWLQKQKSLVRGTRPFLFGLGLARETRPGIVQESVQEILPCTFSGKLSSRKVEGNSTRRKFAFSSSVLKM